MEMEATAGSIALLGAKPSQEASIITRLRAAGAILLGKANMSEWSGCRAGNESGKGWSPRGGQCTSPYHPKMLAAGSSTGSAVSTALGLTFAALGTEVLDSARSLEYRLIRPRKTNRYLTDIRVSSEPCKEDQRRGIETDNRISIPGRRYSSLNYVRYYRALG